MTQASLTSHPQDGRSFAEPPTTQSQPFQEWVARTLGRQHPIALDASVAHGLVHRLDRDTSGAILWARSYAGYYHARLQFAARALRKHYTCLCTGWLPSPPRRVDVPLREPAASSGSSVSVAAANGRPSLTELRSVGHVALPGGLGASLVEVRLHTGRQHQIRAHLAHCGHPLVGDARYGGAAPEWCPRIFLHAGRIGFDVVDGTVDLEVLLPDDLSGAVSNLCAASMTARAMSLRLGQRKTPAAGG